MALTEDDVHRALGTKHVEQFQGTKKDAISKIQEWIAARVESKEAEREAEPA